MAQKKRTTAKKSNSKKVIQPPAHRWAKWLLASIVVGLLGFVLSWLTAYNDVFMSGSPIASVVFAVVGAFLVFYAGFVLLGKFGAWRVVLAFFATVVSFLQYFIWGFFGTTVSSMFWRFEIPVKEGMWITPEGGLLFTASFLFIASLAALLQAGLKRQKHSVAVTSALIVVAALSLYFIVF